MKNKVLPYKNSDARKKVQVEQMFDNISGNYDGINRIITLGSDTRWRRKVVKIIKKTNPKRILDVATGTGDLALKFAQKTFAQQIIGLDLSEGMLAIAKKKAIDKRVKEKVEFIKGDSENLPFEDNFFDAISVSFGIRNFENLDKGLLEINRVLAPKGTLVILETSVPTKFPWKQGYNIYTKAILPLIGKLFSKDKMAYSYLKESASSFPFGEALNNILKKNRFIDVENKPQFFGVATIYIATK